MGAVSEYPVPREGVRCQQCGNRLSFGERAYKTVRTLSADKWYCCEACAREAGYKITWI